MNRHGVKNDYFWIRLLCWFFAVMFIWWTLAGIITLSWGPLLFGYLCGGLVLFFYKALTKKD